MRLIHDTTKNIFCSEEPVQNISQFIELIEQVDDTLGNSQHWFRGVTNKTYNLEPTATRDENWSYDHMVEITYIHEFIQRARSVTDKLHDEWTWYAICQHYGMPTRLLDWSQSALTSLFFAIEDDNGHDSAVWILDPHMLNDLSVNSELVFCTDNVAQTDLDREITNKYKVGAENLPMYPLAVSPPHNDRRISTQKGCFTIHGSQKDAFDKLSLKAEQPFLARIDIDKERKKHIRCQLDTLGIDTFTIYPDLDGLARAMKWNYSQNRLILAQ